MSRPRYTGPERRTHPPANGKVWLAITLAFAAPTIGTAFGYGKLSSSVETNAAELDRRDRVIVPRQEIETKFGRVADALEDIKANQDRIRASQDRLFERLIGGQHPPR